MNQEIAGAKSDDQQEGRQVSPRPAGRQFASDDGAQRHQERHIEDGDDPRWRRVADQETAAANQPRRHQQRQAPTADRQIAGPVGDRSEDETGNRGGDKTEQHFVLVPEQRIYGGRENRNAGKLGNPDR